MTAISKRQLTQFQIHKEERDYLSQKTISYKNYHLFPNSFKSGHASGSKALSCVNNSIGRDKAGVPDNNTALKDFLNNVTTPFVLAAFAFFK